MILEEFINQILLEKLRSKTFRMNEFIKLNSREEVLVYALENLQEIGSGSSRDVFILSSGKVLKVAKSEAGIEQNKLEVSVSNNSKTSSVLAHVLSSNPEGWWLVSELVKPFLYFDEGQKKLLIFLGLSDDFNLQDSLDTIFRAGIEHFEKFNKVNISLDGKLFLKSVLSVIQKTGLSIGDVTKISSYGTAPDGRICLLDYGLNSEIYHKHYGVGW